MTEIIIHLNVDDDLGIRWSEVTDAVAANMRQVGPVVATAGQRTITAEGVTGTVIAVPDGLAPRIGRTVRINGLASSLAGEIVGFEGDNVVVRLTGGDLFRANPSWLSYTDYP